VTVSVLPVCVCAEQVSDEGEEEREAIGEKKIERVVGIDVYRGLAGDSAVDGGTERFELVGRV